MPLRCPSCSTPPPRDPFLCTSCGERLLTFLDEPLGPATGIRVDRPGVSVGPGGSADPGAIDFASGQVPSGAAVDPMPAGFDGRRTGRTVAARRPGNTGPFILKLLFGLFVAVVLAGWEALAGLLFLPGLAIVLWLRPRMHLVTHVGTIIGLTAFIWIVVEVVDLIGSPPRSGATPTPTRAVTTPTVAVGGTPTLVPAARTATATAVVGQNVARISRARARWLRGDYAAARTELDEALTAIPGQPASHNLRALVRIAAGDHEGGVADAEAAVTVSSQATFRDTRAYAYLKVGRYDDAAADYDRLLTRPLPEGNPTAYLGRGIARTAQGRLVEARSDLETGLRLLPDTPPDPQLADLEIAARRALDALPPSPATPSPAGSPAAPGIPAPARSPVPSAAVVETPAPGASPAPSPVVLRPTFPIREPPP